MYVTFWEYQFGETQLLQGTTQLIQHAKYYKAARPRYPLKVGTLFWLSLCLESTMWICYGCMEDEIGGNSHYLFKCSGLTKKPKNEPSLYIKLNTNLTQLGMKKTPILYDLLILRMEKYYRDFSNFVFKIFTVC
jgi:hypothetical protein